MAGGIEEHTCEDGAPRLDLWLAGWSSIGSRKRAKDAVRTGKVDVDGRTVSPSEAGSALPAGVRVSVHWNRSGTSPQKVKADRHLRSAGVRVLHDAQHLIAIDKPAGLLTDTASHRQERERDSLRKRMDTWLQSRGATATICHRIDRDTSGLCLVASDPAVGAATRQLFLDHRPVRQYAAFVTGEVEGDEGEWIDTLRWHPKKLRTVPCHADAKGALRSRAWWTVVERYRGATLLGVQLDTGRRNQIRVQAALRGHPLVGERVYASREVPAMPWRRQALHAWRLALDHPSTGEHLDLVAPLPPDLRWLRGELGGEGPEPRPPAAR